jgi:hypothetical protein
VPNIYKKHLVVPTVGELAKRIGDLLMETILENGG